MCLTGSARRSVHEILVAQLPGQICIVADVSPSSSVVCPVRETMIVGQLSRTRDHIFVVLN